MDSEWGKEKNLRYEYQGHQFIRDVVPYSLFSLFAFVFKLHFDFLSFFKMISSWLAAVECIYIEKKIGYVYRELKIVQLIKGWIVSVSRLMILYGSDVQFDWHYNR